MSTKLYLIPVPIQEERTDTLTPAVIQLCHTITYYFAENAKTARAFLKRIQHPMPLPQIQIIEWPEDDELISKQCIKDWLLTKQDAALISEAGSPCIADPGHALVLAAHQLHVPVISCPGPSSIQHALMVCGLPLTKFQFHWYLSQKEPELKLQLKQLEKESAEKHCTQVWIETPYRTLKHLHCILDNLQSDTLLHISAGIDQVDCFQYTATIAQWRKTKLPDWHKIPAVFCCYRPSSK